MSFLHRVAASYIECWSVRPLRSTSSATPLYHPGRDAPFAAWHVMNWFMAPALLMTLGASYLAKRRSDAGGTVDLKDYLEANTVFYGTVGASIVYFWNWFSSLSPNSVADHQFWVVLGAAMPILMVVAGFRLWKHAGIPRRGSVNWRIDHTFFASPRRSAS